MTKVTITAGTVLIAVGVIAYFASGMASWTALIPSIFGAVLAIIGLISRRPAAHKHAIHVALVFALVGVLASLMNVLQLGALLAGTAKRPGAVIASTALFAVCLVYLGIGINSFIAARKQRKAGA